VRSHFDKCSARGADAFFFGSASAITERCDDSAANQGHFDRACRLLCQLASQLKTSAYVKLLLVIDDYNGCGKK
jgi:hypothetical protein